MQSTRTTNGLGAGEVFAGALFGLLIGASVGLITNPTIGLVAGAIVFLILIGALHNQKRHGRDRRESDGGGDGASSGDWAHDASRRCFDDSHRHGGDGDWGGDGGDGGGDGGGGGD